MNIVKTVEKLAKNHTVLFTIVAAVALCYVMKGYSQGKGLGGISGMTNTLPGSAFGEAGASGYKLNARNPPQPGGALGTASGSCGQGVNYKPSSGLGHNEQNASVSGIATSSFGMPPSVHNKPSSTQNNCC